MFVLLTPVITGLSKSNTIDMLFFVLPFSAVTTPTGVSTVIVEVPDLVALTYTVQ